MLDYLLLLKLECKKVLPCKSQFYKYSLRFELIELVSIRLTAGRKKRKPAAETATTDIVKSFVQTIAIPSLHGVKPPGVSAIDLANEGSLIVTGG